MKASTAKLGNYLYRFAPSLYHPLYSVYKALSDARERRLIAATLRPGMTVIDVGANIGIYSRFFAERVGPSGHVVAVEPDAENYRRLQATVADNSSVRAVHAAASDESGTCVLFISDALNVDHHTYDSGEGRRTISVPAVRIDDLIQPGRPVHLLKMDIQGAEAIALKGAQRVLAENPNIALLFEYAPHAIRSSGHDPERMLEDLSIQGFELTVLGAQDLAALAGPDDYCNIWARRPQHIQS